ncbi:MAG: hypothetical protein WCB02_35210, partial [Bradyrhizobium sp.]
MSRDLVSSSQSDKVDLGDLIRFELDAVGTLDGGRVRLQGPPVALRFEHVQTLGLALHELTTNALKHGALKHPAGALVVSWDVPSNPAHSQPCTWIGESRVCPCRRLRIERVSVES